MTCRIWVSVSLSSQKIWDSWAGRCLKWNKIFYIEHNRKNLNNECEWVYIKLENKKKNPEISEDIYHPMLLLKLPVSHLWWLFCVNSPNGGLSQRIIDINCSCLRCLLKELRFTSLQTNIWDFSAVKRSVFPTFDSPNWIFCCVIAVN